MFTALTGAQKKMATQWPGTHAMAYGVALPRVSAAENRISISLMNAAAQKEPREKMARMQAHALAAATGFRRELAVAK